MTQELLDQLRADFERRNVEDRRAAHLQLDLYFDQTEARMRAQFEALARDLAGERMQ